MTNDCTKQKKSRLTCGNSCLGVLVTGILLIVVAYQAIVRISESRIFLKTDNISLVETFHYRFLSRDDFIQNNFQNDLRVACYFEKINNTSTIITSHPWPDTVDKEIILKESDDYLVLVNFYMMSGLGLRNIDPKRKFEAKSYFSFYHIQKNIINDKHMVVGTEFLGSIETNLYGAWRGKTQRISLSPDGKYVVMSARGVNSRSLGEFRNKDVLLIWKIGDNVVEKDIVDSKGNKIPIIIKTDEG